jgi:ABC-type polysaccharide/polyol phosphate transport system ATPase subunit
VDPDVLLVDEVLAVGDEGFTHKCLDKFAEFRRRNKTILLVTHSLGWSSASATMRSGSTTAG